MSGDFDFEPVPGLPELPPDGERILWQGSPDWRGMAWRAFRIREISLYFLALVAAQPALALLQGGSVAAGIQPMLWVGLAGLVGIGLLALIAWAMARGTIYTITSKRIVMRIGVALPVTINLPFAVVAGAGLRLRRNGTGDLPVAIAGTERVSYIVLWPHARPWQLKRPEPMLRSVPDAAMVADILGRALAAHAGVPASVRALVPAAANDARLPHHLATAS